MVPRDKTANGLPTAKIALEGVLELSLGASL